MKPLSLTLHTHLMIAVALVALSGCASSVPEPKDFVDNQTTVLSRGIEMPVTLVYPKTRSKPSPLVLLVHGHGGTRDEAGAFVRVAEQLARVGIASIRMDFAGCGDSTESFQKNNLTTMRLDIRAAKAFALRTIAVDRKRIAMVGFSMGGRLAALESTRADYRAMVLWAPALDDGADDLKDMFGGEAAYRAMRSIAEKQGYTDFTTSWGQAQQLGLQWFSDMESSRPMDAIADYRGRLTLIHGSADDVVLPEVSARAAAAADNVRDLQHIVIDGADHGFGLFNDRPEFARQLVHETVTYLESALR
ncbi:MAG: alpha/beta fold hydrolase [Pseudomonadota bacterium]